jgi:pimeloyl-ACP methyl ester carboxylesterase
MKGESTSSIAKALAAPGVANLLPDSHGFLWIKQNKFHDSFCQDLTQEEALVMAVTQKAPLVGTFGDKITSPAWKNKPSWYQISSGDRMLAPETEKMMSDRLGAKMVITLDASHASLASRPDEVTALIDEAANATQS